MKKSTKVILWLFLWPFFSFYLLYKGWRNKSKPMMLVGAVISALILIVGIASQPSQDIPSATEIVYNTTQPVQQVADKPTSETIKDNDLQTNTNNIKTESVESQPDKNVTNNNLYTPDETTEQPVNNESVGIDFAGYKQIQVAGGDLSGYREPSVVVDIGFGDREYYAFTNEHGQLIKVTAHQIILQDESTEHVTSKGRYYPDEAKVPGTESETLDEGHVIADSLGGVSNAYNITPQDSTLNRHGDQAYMEKVIRDAGGCSDFVAEITYPNTETQIPSHYKFTYTLRGNVIIDEFDNINPDEVNSTLDDNSNQDESTEKMEAMYVGSRKSDKYHYPSCRYAKKIKDSNLIEFTDKEDAESRGYKPCGACKP